ncbi:hypothetical protein RS030_81164 [Cryptosporidium xiaoi]|uniref:Uncharacterized protein n=1 Tax=Cryptosporidium xiaoi TaxID=659607 RepID=A0AAV9XSN4_9CRYT
MDPQFRLNLRPVLGNNSLNTPRIFIRSTSVGNNGHHVTKTPTTTYRNSNENKISSYLINSQNSELYQAFTPVRMHNNFVFSEDNNSGFQPESENYPQISTENIINLKDRRIVESDIIPTYRSDIYSSNRNIDFIFDENIAKPTFTYLTSLPESNLTSTSASENEVNTLNLEKFGFMSIKKQEDQNLIQTKEITQRSSNVESEIENETIAENEFQDKILPTETQTSMEILITPPESSELVRRNDFYISDETMSKSQVLEASLTNSFNQSQKRENCIIKKENPANREDKHNYVRNSNSRMRFSHLCTSIIDCLFPWVNYGQYQDDKPKIYYDVPNDEGSHLLQKN